MSTMTAPAKPKAGTIDLGWIAEDALTVTEQADRLDDVLERLRDLCDSRVRLPDPAALRERVTELVRELEGVSERIADLGNGIYNRVEDAIGGEESAS